MKKVFEVIIDESSPFGGVNAISLVDSPAIEIDWVALKKEVPLKLKEVDADRQVLMGPALIPNKPIFRVDGEDEFYILFSKETILRSSELFFMRGKQSETTLMHESPLMGNTVVESWIKEDMEKDKSAVYGIDAPIGTWMISMKIDDAKLYQEAMEGKLKGFSIEGYFLPEVREHLAKLSKGDIVEKIKEVLKDG